MAARMSLSSSRSRIISPETACETFNTVASSNCSIGAPLCALRRRVPIRFPQARVQLDELPHFAVGSPSLVAVPSFSQVEIRECFEATRRIEPRGQLVRQTFILDEALLMCAPNGLLIQAFGLEFPAVKASNLRAHQRGAMRKFSGQCSAQSWRRL